ncbi:MAG: hypothetical protein LIP08_04355 [Bacteroides sp.]|nr:hypothetical protein [Bacteroides sp.]
MSLVKLQIQGYADELFNKRVATFDVQINPASLKLDRSVNYTNTQASGEPQKQKFNNLPFSTLSFDLIFDDTGFVENKQGKINDRINRLEKAIYSINGETHEPNYTLLVWGDLVFKGRLSSLNYDYSVFKPDGAPLRVKISLKFVGHKEGREKKSPDLSRIIVLKAGESIPWLCQKYYNDPSYCVEIARINRLKGFRDVSPGTRLLSPPWQEMAEQAGKGLGKRVCFTVCSEGVAIGDRMGVISVHISRAVNRVGRCTIVLDAGDMPSGEVPESDDDTFAPGKDICVEAGYDDEESVVFEGMVTTHGLTIGEGNESRLVVECREYTYLLTLGRKNRVFEDARDSEAICAIVGDCAGLQADVSETAVTHPQLVQYGCTDWDFIRSRTDATGMVVVTDGKN